MKVTIEVSIRGSEYVKIWDCVLVYSCVEEDSTIALKVCVVGQPFGSDLRGSFYAAVTCDT